MANIILAIHLILSLIIVALVLMQQGKGSNMGASFGSGASNTVFGSRESISFFGKVTSGVVALFFVTSLLLAWIAKQEYQGADSGIDQLIEGIEEKVQQQTSLPNLEQEETVQQPDPQDQTSNNQ